jgi:DNA-binding response OmpR family regulator
MFAPQGPDAEALDVLFIEDDADVAEMYRLKLELDGYFVRVVSRETAVAAARTSRPDILFLDLSTGLAEGVHLLGAIRTAVRRSSLPAIVLAKSGYDQLRSQGTHLSPNDYVVRVPLVTPSPTIADPGAARVWLDRAERATLSSL